MSDSPSTFTLSCWVHRSMDAYSKRFLHLRYLMPLSLLPPSLTLTELSRVARLFPSCNKHPTVLLQWIIKVRSTTVCYRLGNAMWYFGLVWQCIRNLKTCAPIYCKFLQVADRITFHLFMVAIFPLLATLFRILSLSISHDTVNLVMSLYYNHPDGIKYYFAWHQRNTESSRAPRCSRLGEVGVVCCSISRPKPNCSYFIPLHDLKLSAE